MKKLKEIVIIDDDAVSNFLTEQLIVSDIVGISVKSFTEPYAGLTYLTNNLTGNEFKTLLLLDINMPIMDGWEFLKLFEECPSVIKEKAVILMFSSSINPVDHELAESNPLVGGFVTKPLDIQNFISLLDGIDTHDSI